MARRRRGKDDGRIGLDYFGQSQVVGPRQGLSSIGRGLSRRRGYSRTFVWFRRLIAGVVMPAVGLALIIWSGSDLLTAHGHETSGRAALASRQNSGGLLLMIEFLAIGVLIVGLWLWFVPVRRLRRVRWSAVRRRAVRWRAGRRSA